MRRLATDDPLTISEIFIAAIESIYGYFPGQFEDVGPRSIGLFVHNIYLHSFAARTNQNK